MNLLFFDKDDVSLKVNFVMKTQKYHDKQKTNGTQIQRKLSSRQKSTYNKPFAAEDKAEEADEVETIYARFKDTGDAAQKRRLPIDFERNMLEEEDDGMFLSPTALTRFSCDFRNLKIFSSEKINNFYIKNQERSRLTTKT